MNTRKNIVFLFVFLALACAVSASTGSVPTPAQMSEVTDLNNGLKTVAAALAVLVITYSGIKWLMADGAQERDDAKKTIMYVIIGLIVVTMAEDLTNALYRPVTGCLVQ